MQTRRSFIEIAAAISASLGLGLAGCSSGESPEPSATAATDSPATEPASGMNILILGGTGFIGPHMVERAQERGHTVTLFNRGRTNVDLFPGVETLIGDRDGQLDSLKGRTWDAVIDNSGYVPRHVRDSANLLKEATDHYLFISSISAYADFESVDITEDYALGTMEDETVEEVTGETYGPMKALCEKAVAQALPDSTTIVRPGYIVGPGDRSDRWTYWPLRMRAGGEMIAPGLPSDPIQIIDARDLAAFVVKVLEDKAYGTYNAVGPAARLTMENMLETITLATGESPELAWVDAETLEANNVSVPIWNPEVGEFGGAHQVSHARAIAAGMSFIPLKDTVRDTLAWWDTLPEERQNAMRSGFRMSDGAPESLRPKPASLSDQMAQEAALLENLRTAEAAA